MTTSRKLSLPTRVAHVGYDGPRFLGFDVYNELVGKESLTGLVALAVTGRRQDAETCSLLNDIASILTVADPRIWPVKLARVGSAFGSFLSGLAMGTLCMNTIQIGPKVTSRSAGLYVDLKSKAEEKTPSENIQDVVRNGLENYKVVPGFGVPGRERDERIPALKELVARKSRNHMPYWTLFEQIEQELENRKIRPNIGSAVAAVLLDAGFSPEEIELFSVMIGINGVFPNAVEGARQAPGVLQRLPEETIDYVGQEPRISPRAAAGDDH